jgi:hypothetical protein
MFCKNCGKEIGESAFCSECGAATHEKVATPTSTYGNVVPFEVRRWNWGAFLFNAFWGIGNKTYLPLICFIPFIGFIWAFVCGAKGNEWAFKSNNYTEADLPRFLATQETWNRAGIARFVFAIISGILVVLFYLLFFYAIMAMVGPYGTFY